MQAFSNPHPPAPILFGKRRGKSDVALFSSDLGWDAVASNSTRHRAYPSPPMSDSPPPPGQRKPSIDDRGQPGYSEFQQNVLRGLPTPRMEPRADYRVAPPVMQYRPMTHAPPNYPPYQHTGGAAAEQYQQQQQQRGPTSQVQPPHLGQQMYATEHQRRHEAFGSNDRVLMADGGGFASPKTQRKTKGHVASACVPCKRAHLRCDAQRPCDRCMNTGKEDACIDVQHKKRGRPRLRDERESRYEGMVEGYPPPPEQPLRRPMSVYPADEAMLHDPAALHRGGPYRVLKSHTGLPPNHRFRDHASPADATLYLGPSQSTPRTAGDEEVPCAYLNMRMQFSRASRTFCDAVGLQSVSARKLSEIVAARDRDKVLRIQRSLEDERQHREPNYLPPIYGSAEEERVIQSIGMGLYDLAQFSLDRSEMLAFQRPDGQQRLTEVRFCLAKKDSTYFVVLLAAPFVASQEAHHVLSGPYPREAMYSFQTVPQVTNRPYAGTSHGSYAPQYTEPRPHEQSSIMRQPMSIGMSPAPVSTASDQPYGQPLQRPMYPGPGYLNETMGSQLSQGLPQRQNELQLPPIRSQVIPPLTGSRRADERSGRVDIGVLLEKPIEQSDFDRKMR